MGRSSSDWSPSRRHPTLNNSEQENGSSVFHFLASTHQRAHEHFPVLTKGNVVIMEHEEANFDKGYFEESLDKLVCHFSSFLNTMSSQAAAIFTATTASKKARDSPLYSIREECEMSTSAGDSKKKSFDHLI